VNETLFSLLGATPCACGRCRHVPTERVYVTADLAGALRGELDGSPALLLGDPRTLAACGERHGSTFEACGLQLDWIDLERPGSTLHADRQAVDEARRQLEARPEAVPVAVGSGTVNDVVKSAAGACGRRYLSLATAASMNGYTSAIAAITDAGLKLTVPAPPPVAVLADPAVLAAAPSRLAVSGLADLLSKPVSAADWRLGQLLWEEPYCPIPATVAGRAVERAVAVAGGIGRGEPSAVLVLFEALLLSGISMAVAGTSSPASGGEHLISHYLDMTARHAPGGPRTPALHGEQVGVGTRVTTALYAALLARGEPQIDWERAARDAPEIAQLPSLLNRAPWIPPPLRESILGEARRKLERLGDGPTRVAAARRGWERVRRTLRDDLDAALRYAAVLPSVGAPTRAADIGVPAGEFRVAYRLARWIRDRYTVLDLADDLGLLAELEDDVLRGIG